MGKRDFGEYKQFMKGPTTDQELLQALREQRDKDSGLCQVIDLHMEVIAARSEIEVQPLGAVPGQKEVGRLLDQRVPILRCYELEWDVEAFTALAARVCDVGARERQELAPHFEEVRGLLLSDPERTLNVVARYLAEGKAYMPTGPNETQELLSFVLIHSLHPFLHAYAVVLTPSMKDELWYQRLCPLCGGEPDFGYLEKEVGGLRLLCSRCDTVWTYKRGECTFCGNSNKETFAYYIGETTCIASTCATTASATSRCSTEGKSRSSPCCLCSASSLLVWISQRVKRGTDSDEHSVDGWGDGLGPVEAFRVIPVGDPEPLVEI